MVYIGIIERGNRARNRRLADQGRSIESMLAEARRQGVRTGHTHSAATMPDCLANHIADMATPLINLVLYLCAANADFGADRPVRPRPTRTRRGWKLFPPDKPRVWGVGARVGAALRAAHLSEQTDQPTRTTETGRQSPRPHIRRAHWHTYLVGEGRAESILKWLPPIPINVDDGDIVPTIREVRP